MVFYKEMGGGYLKLFSKCAWEKKEKNVLRGKLLAMVTATTITMIYIYNCDIANGITTTPGFHIQNGKLHF